jgi:D-2-hydroxyacid dehydrogenase (NADP+)
MTLLIALPPAVVTEAQRVRIATLLPKMPVVVSDDPNTIAATMTRATIAAARVPFDLVAQAPRLGWFQQWEAGIDWMAHRRPFAAPDLVVTTASGIHAVPIAEHVFAMLLAFGRMLPTSFRAQERREWLDRERGRYFELAGEMLLIVGLGAIGTQVGLLGSALGMRVIGIRHSAGEPPPGIEHVVGPDQLAEYLPLARAVVLVLPATPATIGLIGARELRLMRPDAYLINVGRGATVDEPALIQALREGTIAGAGLDVFAEEPLPAHSPLWEMENVIVTAHYAGSTPRYNERAMALFLDNLERLTNGAPLRNVANPERGY